MFILEFSLKTISLFYVFVSVSAFVCKFVFVFYIPHIGEIIWCFSVLITLLCIIPYWSICVFANVKMPFFLWLRNIPLYICTPPLHNSSIGGIAQVADMSWLSYMTLWWKKECIYLFKSVLLFYLNQLPVLKLLDHTVFWFLIF